MNPLEFQVLISGVLWRCIQEVCDKLVEVFPQIADDEHPLAQRCHHCPSRMGKAAHKRRHAEILFDNQADSTSAWGPGAILLIPDLLPLRSKTGAISEKPMLFRVDWTDFTVVDQAIRAFKQRGSGPIELFLQPGQMDQPVL